MYFAEARLLTLNACTCLTPNRAARHRPVGRGRPAIYSVIPAAAGRRGRTTFGTRGTLQLVIAVDPGGGQLPHPRLRLLSQSAFVSTCFRDRFKI
jgi:hypothetical protein